MTFQEVKDALLKIPNHDGCDTREVFGVTIQRCGESGWKMVGTNRSGGLEKIAHGVMWFTKE